VKTLVSALVLPLAVALVFVDQTWVTTLVWDLVVALAVGMIEVRTLVVALAVKTLEFVSPVLVLVLLGFGPRGRAWCDRKIRRREFKS
jgi:hypothetical protein